MMRMTRRSHSFWHARLPSSVRSKKVEKFFCESMNLDLCRFEGGSAVRCASLSSRKMEPSVPSWVPDIPLCRGLAKADLGTLTFLAGLDFSTHVLEAAGCDVLEGHLCAVLGWLLQRFQPISRTAVRVALRNRLSDVGAKEVFNGGVRAHCNCVIWRTAFRCFRRTPNGNSLGHFLSAVRPLPQMPRLRAVFERDLDDRSHLRHRSAQCSCRMLTPVTRKGGSDH